MTKRNQLTLGGSNGNLGIQQNPEGQLSLGGGSKNPLARRIRHKTRSTLDEAVAENIAMKNIGPINIAFVIDKTISTRGIIPKVIENINAIRKILEDEFGEFLNFHFIRYDDSGAREGRQDILNEDFVAGTAAFYQGLSLIPQCNIFDNSEYNFVIIAGDELGHQNQELLRTTINYFRETMAHVFFLWDETGYNRANRSEAKAEVIDPLPESSSALMNFHGASPEKLAELIAGIIHIVLKASVQSKVNTGSSQPQISLPDMQRELIARLGRNNVPQLEGPKNK